VQSTVPLYRSQRFGLKLFHPKQIERVRSSREYVVNHPNRVRFQEISESMASLAGRYDFRVIVLIAPTDARMYAPFFDDFPALSEQPYFNDLVAERAGQSSFEVFNLQTLTEPYAQKELLYFRDDDHWNERGHEVVAEIIARSLATSQAPPL
jgi:SGNH hydrolase-like domain, acetyltransferase AlgX